jgi:prephenate dehydrogenase
LRVAVVGLGLIGGSIALAARERLSAEVTGWDADPAAVAAAVERGVIISGAGSLASAVAEADAVFTAVPVGALPQVIGGVLSHAPSGAVVTDVGSTKRTIVEAISDLRFVGGHPLAGAETSGVEHARGDMFDGAPWYLTPGVTTAAETVARTEELIAALGARVTRLAASEHDRLMAAVSHLPHVFANVLVAHALEFGVHFGAGPSFRDATRVAGANPEVWSAIFLDNRDEIGVAIDDAIASLEEFRDYLTQDDKSAVLEWCRQAAADREKLKHE